MLYLDTVHSTSQTVKSQFLKSSRLVQLMHFPTMAAVVLCVVGGIREFDSTPSKFPSGKPYIPIGIAVYIFVYLIQIYSLSRLPKITTTSRKVMHACSGPLSLQILSWLCDYFTALYQYLPASNHSHSSMDPMESHYFWRPSRNLSSF
ncbi:Forkhead transcription factor [Clarireedia jacksonii]